MFFVVNKDKLVTYIVSIMMVVLLFTFFTGLTSKSEEETQLTSSNNSRLLPIYNVKTDDSNVSLTMNCAW